MALDLELRLESAAPLGKCADDRPREREVAGTASVSAAPERVHPPHDLRRQADAGREGEAPAVDAAQRDPARAVARQRFGHLPCRTNGIPRETQRTRQDAGAATGQEADRHVRLEPVQRLVEDAVAGEDDDGIGASAAGGGH